MGARQKEVRLDGRVAIVTGSGRGLGRSYACALAARGARVVINDLPGRDDDSAADPVVEEIRKAGGEARASYADVSELDQVDAMVAETIGVWGHVDILVNNAGIVRDKTFARLSVDDFRRVIDVHLAGTFNCCKAVWQSMGDREYGRIVNIVSAAGVFGNFGQSNYAAAKMAIVGLTNTLHLEGASRGINSNCFAPTAATEMTAGILPDDMRGLLAPESVVPGLIHLCSEDAPSRTILAAAAGSYSRILIRETKGVFLANEENSPEVVAEMWQELSDENSSIDPENAAMHVAGLLSRS